MGSSDNHTARPGTGYKEVNRRGTTDGAGPMTEANLQTLRPELGPPLVETQTFNSVDEVFDSTTNAFQLLEAERQAGFFLSGGLIAVHSENRTRNGIWDAMDKREIYATSGPRILLWFDLENGPEGLAPMGSEVALNEAPRFTVRAAGSFKQKPGCPENVTQALGAERTAYVCQNECYNPSEERRVIDRVEIIKIRPAIL